MQGAWTDRRACSGKKTSGLAAGADTKNVLFVQSKGGIQQKLGSGG